MFYLVVIKTEDGIQAYEAMSDRAEAQKIATEYLTDHPRDTYILEVTDDLLKKVVISW